jgi:hypothetical protein
MKSFKSFITERCWPGYKSVPGKKAYSLGSCVKEEDMEEDWSQKYKSSIDCNNPKGFSQKAHCAGKKKNEDVNEDWSKVNKSDKTDGLSQKAVDVYRRENPGSKLKTAVTKDPSKLKAGSKDANRRKSFCSRMGGMKKRLTNPENARDPDSPINKALRRWNC